MVAYDGPAHGASTGRLASLPEFARALRAVAEEVGPVHGVVGHSLGGAAVTLALRDGLAADRVVLLAAPSDVVRFSTAFADHLRLDARHPNRHAEQPGDPAPHAMGRAPRADDRGVDFSTPPWLFMTAATRTCRTGKASRSRRPGRALGLVSTEGLGHRALLRDPAVIRQVVDFLSEARPR